MRVTVLVENDTQEGRGDLKAEFGLSLLVETAKSRILFDTGATGVFADNAQVLGIDLTTVDAAVLSHHHFDHGGGLERFLEINDRAPVYLRRAPHQDRTFRLFGLVNRAIGLDMSLFERRGERLIEIGESTEIAPDIFLLTEVRGDHPRPRGNRHLWVEGEHGATVDPFDHELMMVVHEEGGMVVFTGCSHNGVLNMVDAAISAFPDVPVRTVVGGLHLIGLPFYDSMAASRREVEDLARAIGDRCQGEIVTGHCTGKKAHRVLGKALENRLRSMPTGTVLELP